MDLISEFETQLAQWSVTYAGRPRQELRVLWTVALEREQLVNVAYNAPLIRRRLQRANVDPEAIRVITTAIGWVWRDEQMHTVFIRGTLLKESRLPARLRTWLSYATGSVAGWSSSRQQHNAWRHAPVTRTAAEAIEVLGRLAGQIPEVAGDQLRYQTFAAFCAYSVAAETTAALGWERMATVGRIAGIPAEDILTFSHIADDERRHAAIFRILAGAFDNDRLTIPASELTKRIAQVGQRFLSLPSESDAAWNNPTGKGAAVVVSVSQHSDTADDAVQSVLSRLSLPQWSAPHTVAIRATFMHGYHRHDPSSHVSPALLDALARALRDRGATDVIVLESPNLYDRFFDGRDVQNVARYLGFTSPHYRVQDATDHLAPHPYLRGHGRDRIAFAWRDADLRIVFGKLRSHPTTGAMASLEAMEGLCGRHDDTLWGDRRTDRHTAAVMVLDAFPPHLALVDAWRDVPDGLLGMLSCPDPIQPLRLYASQDALALDLTATRHTGGDPADSGLITVAMDWFGDPTEASSVIGDDTPIVGWRRPDLTRFEGLLTTLAEPLFVHASGRGAAFIPDMDAVAFPERDPPSAPLRLARAAVRRITGLASLSAHSSDLVPTRQLSVRGRSLRVAKMGSGPPVVLLHGYPDTLQITARLMRRLAVTHTVYAFDWPGTGLSDPWPGALTPDALAERLGHLLDVWGLRRVALIASDMGGPAGLCFAARYPERTAAIAVLNSLLFHDAPTSPEIALMRRMGLATLAFMTSPRLMYARCVRTFLPPDWTLPDSVDDDLWSAFSTPTVRKTLARMCRDYERALPTLPHRYNAVKCPVLALWADDEHHFDAEHGRRLVTGHNNRRFHTVPGGHWMAWSHTERTATAITSFLEGARWTP